MQPDPWMRPLPMLACAYVHVPFGANQSGIQYSSTALLNTLMVFLSVCRNSLFWSTCSVVREAYE